MEKPWKLNKTWFTSVAKILSLFLIIAVMAAGCGGGSSGSSGGGGGGNGSDNPPPFNPEAGIITKILDIDTAACPEVTVFFSVSDQETGEPGDASIERSLPDESQTGSVSFDLKPKTAQETPGKRKQRL